MRLGISSWAYPWSVGVPGSPPPAPLGPFELLERAHAHGVHVLQIADNLPLAHLSEADLRRLRERADQLDIRIEVGTVGIDPEHLHTYRKVAKTLGSSILRVVIDTPERKPTHDEIVRGVGEIMPAFEQDDVRLLIENHDRFPARSLESILRGIDHPYLGICLDTVNSLGSLETVELVLETLHPWIGNVHIKDFAIRRKGHKMGFEVLGTPAGKGDLRIPRLVEALRAVDRHPSVILELWPPPEEDVASTIAKEERWVEESVRYLRQYV